MSRINFIASNAVAFNNATAMQIVTNQIKHLFKLNININYILVIMLLHSLCMRSFNIFTKIKTVIGNKNQLKCFIKKLQIYLCLEAFDSSKVLRVTKHHLIFMKIY